jgi:hypothetical protein
MQVKIEINCESGGELLSHLAKIMIDMDSKIQAIKSNGGEARKPLYFLDNNCYGEHLAKVKDFSFDELEQDWDLTKMDYREFIKE